MTNRNLDILFHHHQCIIQCVLNMNEWVVIYQSKRPSFYLQRLFSIFSSNSSVICRICDIGTLLHGGTNQHSV